MTKRRVLRLCRSCVHYRCSTFTREHYCLCHAVNKEDHNSWGFCLHERNSKLQGLCGEEAVHFELRREIRRGKRN
jgi:hypothetical protein